MWRGSFGATRTKTKGEKTKLLNRKLGVCSAAPGPQKNRGEKGAQINNGLSSRVFRAFFVFPFLREALGEEHPTLFLWDHRDLRPSKATNLELLKSRQVASE